MSTTVSHSIAVFESPMAFNKNPAAQRFWNRAVKSRINGWGFIELERHRVSAIKGTSIVHFAPEGADLNNPVVLSVELMAATRQTAKNWCRANKVSVTRESIHVSIHEEIKESVRVIASVRKEVFEAESLDDKVLAHRRMKVHEATLQNQRLNIFAAEDAVDDCIRDRTMDSFASLAHLFPKVALLIEQLLKKRTDMVESA